MPRPFLEPATPDKGIAQRALALTALSCLLASLMLSLVTAETPLGAPPRAASPAGLPPPPTRSGIDTAPDAALAVAADRLARPVVHLRRPAADTTTDAELLQQFERHALNALLVPVIDDEADRPSWADPSLSLPCGPATRVQVDHRPLQPGTPQSGRAFVLSWELDRCAPFGLEGPLLTGRAELDVFRDDDGVSAIVRAQGLQIERHGRQVWLDKTFTARMP